MAGKLPSHLNATIESPYDFEIPKHDWGFITMTIDDGPLATKTSCANVLRDSDWLFEFTLNDDVTLDKR